MSLCLWVFLVESSRYGLVVAVDHLDGEEPHEGAGGLASATSANHHQVIIVANHLLFLLGQLELDAVQIGDAINEPHQG